MKVSLTRKYKLPMRHFIPLDAQGFSSLPHGHDFQVLVSLGVRANGAAESFQSRDALDQVMEDCVLMPLRHQLINDYTQNGTVESLGQEILRRLSGTTIADQLVKLEIIETRKNAAQFYPTFSSVST